MPARLREAEARRASFSPAVVALFRELDGAPARAREAPAFKAKARQLACELGLVSEFWTVNSVLDRSHAPCWPPWVVAFHDWHRCRGVRERLLGHKGNRTLVGVHVHTFDE
jgi:hypothetical protein